MLNSSAVAENAEGSLGSHYFASLIDVTDMKPCDCYNADCRCKSFREMQGNVNLELIKANPYVRQSGDGAGLGGDVRSKMSTSNENP